MFIGKGGETLKRIGSSARKKIENLFDIQVMLTLNVVVENNWKSSVKGLKKVGYTESR